MIHQTKSPYLKLLAAFIALLSLLSPASTTFAQTLEYQANSIIEFKGKSGSESPSGTLKPNSCTTPDNGVLVFSNFKNYARIGSKTIYQKGDFRLLCKLDSIGKIQWYRLFLDSVSYTAQGSLRVDKEGTIYLMAGKAKIESPGWPSRINGLICISPDGAYKWSKTGFNFPSLESAYIENPLSTFHPYKGVFVSKPIKAFESVPYGILQPDGQFKAMNNDFKNLPYQSLVYYHPYNGQVYFYCPLLLDPGTDWKVDSQLTLHGDKDELSVSYLLSMDTNGTLKVIGTFRNYQYINPYFRFCATGPNRLVMAFTYRANDTLWYNGKMLGISNSVTNPAQICLDRNGNMQWFAECDYTNFGGSSTSVFEHTYKNGKIITLYNFLDNFTGINWSGLWQEGGGQFLLTLDTATGKATRVMKTFYHGGLGMLSDTKYAELVTIGETIEFNGNVYSPIDSINQFFIVMADTFTKPNSIAENRLSMAQVYPNPSHETFSIDWGETTLAQAAIYNTKGVCLKIIHQGDPTSFGSTWPKGMYIIKISDTKGAHSVHKILKM